MNLIELTKKTTSTVLKSQLTKTIVAAAVGYVASKKAGEYYQEHVIGQPDSVSAN